MGLSVLGECMVYEELAQANACFRDLIGTNNGIGSWGIILDGTEEQKQKYLPKLASANGSAVSRSVSPRRAPMRPMCRPPQNWTVMNGC